MRTLVSLIAVFIFIQPAIADIDVNLGRGPITIQEPAGYDPLVPAPVIILLHGFGNTGPGVESYMQFEKHQDEYGFLYATPNGTLFGGNRFWDATDACCNFTPSPVDDSGYLSDLLDSIEAHFNVDRNRIYFTGHSNGGFMSYRMACDHSDRVAAIASFAGATWDDPLDCSAAEPVSVLQIHGTSDGTILYNGGNLVGTPYPGAVESVEQWAAFNGCSVTPETLAITINITIETAGPETIVIQYQSDCDQGRVSELWSIPGAGHSPLLAGTYSRKVIDWLYAHPKPEAVGVASATGRPANASTSFGIASTMPNPFRSATEVLYRPGAGANSALAVYDVRGRLVRALQSSVVQSGSARAFWDGRDNAGRKAPAGIYFVNLTGGGESSTRKVILAR
ncbi:MAG: T9SS type A sorting domain-containing protein [Gemmatimonadetes bacterium]|nr:T9SS type A sorting domain-containing protein [Gemmatimonadota bacterium]